MSEDLFELEQPQGLFARAIKNTTPASEFTNLLIVDVMNTAFRFKSRGQYDFEDDMVAMINSLAKSYEAKKVVCCGDWGSSSYRKEIYPEYKANRKEKYANQTEEEKQQSAKFFEGLDKCYQRLSNEFILLRYKNVEADDLMAYTVIQAEQSDEFDKIWIVSTDRDMAQMVSPTVSQFSYKTRKEYTINNMYDSLGVDTPQEYAIFKAISGDPGDGIPTAAEDCGIKRSYALIRGMEHVSDLLELLPIAGKQKYIQRLNANEDKVIRNWELTNLREYCKVAINHPDPNNSVLVDELLRVIL